jgi:hypothetical protein
MNKNNLNKELFGANAFISISRTNQSKEKNDSFGAFILLDCENTLVKLVGISILKDNEADIN